MPEINILPKEIYQLIAAGEVVERPSSIVKEMIENSIDAKAKNITVEIKNGGTTYIRITDDGCGIDKSQIKKVFISHATSKISTKDDLNSISTLGFRGEAMASISAVSKVELLTRGENENVGTRYEIAGGEELDFDEAGCPKGTTIVVRDIFFNTPARMKFLKKDVTEGNSVAGVVDRMAIAHPEISFRFIRDGKQTLITSGNGNLQSAIYSVFGKEAVDGLIEVDYTYENMRVTGFVSKPASSRKSRSMQFFFINNRLIKSATAMAALEQAYKNTIMVGRFPMCVLNIQLNPALVDVNVHPAKIEVRFANEKPVFNLVYYGVKSAVDSDRTVKEADFSAKAEQIYNAPAKDEREYKAKLDFFKKKAPAPVQQTFSSVHYNSFSHVNSPVAEYKLDADESDNESEILETEELSETAVTDKVLNKEQKTNFEQIIIQSQHEQADSSSNIDIIDDNEEKNQDINFRLIGEAFKTYIIIEIEKELYFIDKHAAHERMNYENFKAQSTVEVQMLLSPVAVNLTKDEFNAVTENEDLLLQCGFEIEEFGGSAVIVRSIPALVGDSDVKDLITEIAQKLLEHKTDITPDKIDWIYHSASCRGAVKAGDFTSPQEQELFVKKLLSMPQIRFCPHGRPVFIKISKYDIEKQFGRV
ncbi:MAG: DNA mismatch repair endonuclease MutL [Acetobacter sp.]|nr:DNA mismatch repair endonuclease MutL [Bacteroides sp.]MCM1340236.1 DNA mismatch repair endonuclease MutL [Acetobacter sp.]MCM1432812.1 DNA mismatch repair endonuclease MutL [Clostridiales bacterium]